jgi:hypothetical protein
MNSIELRTVDGGSIVITGARRVHTKNISDHGTWNGTDNFFTTSDGAELEIDGMYDILHFEEWQDEVAAKAFRVLDEPMKERWLQIVAQILLILQAAPLEEVVKDEREETKPEELKAA